MQAIILAGGFGTRLRGVTGEDVPKPMASLGGEPFLAHLLRNLQRQGVTEAVLCVHHRREVIRRYFQNAFEGVRLLYSEEETPLGTGGALRQGLALLKDDEPVLALNGDCFIDLNVPAMAQAHRHAGVGLTIALKRMPDCSRYGEAMMGGQGRITSFRYPGGAAPGWISTGAYIVSPTLFSGFMLPPAFSFESDFQRPFASALRPLAWPVEGYFIDIGLPEDYARAEEEIPRRMAA